MTDEIDHLRDRINEHNERLYELENHTDLAPRLKAIEIRLTNLEKVVRILAGLDDKGGF